MVEKYYGDAGRNYWGDGGQILGECIPHPPGFVSLYVKHIFHKTLFTKHCLQNILHDHKN